MQGKGPASGKGSAIIINDGYAMMSFGAFIGHCIQGGVLISDGRILHRSTRYFSKMLCFLLLVGLGK